MVKRGTNLKKMTNLVPLMYHFLKFGLVLEKKWKNVPFVRTLGHPHPFTNSKVSSHNTLAVSSLVYLSIVGCNSLIVWELFNAGK